ncbi:MAG: hypothetical protein AB4057_18525 [Crocosphaera sp.]
MFEPFHPSDFCAYWIPKLFNLHPGSYGYRKACLLLLSTLTESPEATCANWIDYSKPTENALESSEKSQKVSKTPLHLQKFLRVVHILWNLEESLPLTLLSLKKDLSEYLD